jgi:glycosyltransferase involved in cell wall biosynthesis
MKISVIVTTKNEERNIENCLASVKKQNFPKDQVEIVVVDNDSTDGTRGIARKFTDKVFTKGPERSAQRNFGAREATGKYLLYLDADMILSPDIIRDCAEKMDDDDSLAGLYVSEKIRGKGYWGKVRNFERSFYDGTSIDAVRFVRKETFWSTGGFDEKLTGPEDWDFDKKIRSAGKVGLVKTPVFHNEENFGLKKYLKRKKYYSQDFQKYIRKWGKDDADIKKQFRFWYRYIGVFTEKGKWKKLLRHPVLAAGVYFLRFLVGFNLIFS